MKQLIIEHSEDTSPVLCGLQKFIKGNVKDLDFDQIVKITFMKLNESILLSVSTVQYIVKITRIK